MHKPLSLLSKSKVQYCPKCQDPYRPRRLNGFGSRWSANCERAHQINLLCADELHIHWHIAYRRDHPAVLTCRANWISPTRIREAIMHKLLIAQTARRKTQTKTCSRSEFGLKHQTSTCACGWLVCNLNSSLFPNESDRWNQNTSRNSQVAKRQNVTE